MEQAMRMVKLKKRAAFVLCVMLSAFYALTFMPLLQAGGMHFFMGLFEYSGVNRVAYLLNIFFLTFSFPLTVYLIWSRYAREKFLWAGLYGFIPFYHLLIGVIFF